MKIHVYRAQIVGAPVSHVMLSPESTNWHIRPSITQDHPHYKGQVYVGLPRERLS